VQGQPVTKGQQTSRPDATFFLDLQIKRRNLAFCVVHGKQLTHLPVNRDIQLMCKKYELVIAVFHNSLQVAVPKTSFFSGSQPGPLA
jgi:hypothetical protein